jgi:hypothetical protein
MRVVKTQMTDSQRRVLRDYVCSVGVSKSPELLTALSEIEIQTISSCSELALLQIFLTAKRHGKQVHFCLATGFVNRISPGCLVQFLPVLRSAQFVHGWNGSVFPPILHN